MAIDEHKLVLISIRELEKFCKGYDREEGMWPRSKFEGQSLYNFVCGQLELEEDLDNYTWLAIEDDE